MTLKSFLLLDGSLEGLEPGEVVTIAGTEGHHGARVMRLRAGESVLITDTAGYQSEGAVAAVAKSDFTVRLSLAPEAAQPSAPAFVLVQALAKGGRDEAALETATELGVDTVIAWQADRCVVQWKGEKATKGLERWRATLYSAVKQSRRALIPSLEAAVDTPTLAQRVAQASHSGAAVFVLHEAADWKLSQRVGELAAREHPPGEIWFVVGPEGGISEAELEQLSGAGAHVVKLGSEILRASSAGPAAIAALCYAFGRW